MQDRSDFRTIFQLNKELLDGLANEARAHLDASKSDDCSYDDRVDALGLYLETMAAIEDAGGDPRKVWEEIDKTLVEKAIASLDAEGLEAAADELLGAMHAAIDDPFDREHLDLLNVAAEQSGLLRQRFYRRIKGAQIVLNRDVDPGEPVRKAVEYFDTAVRTMGWALASSNGKREGHAMLLEPEKREKQWWWTDALDVSWETIRTAGEVADLVERYPTFLRYFDCLRRSARRRMSIGFPGQLLEKATTEYPDEEMAEKQRSHVPAGIVREPPGEYQRLAAAPGLQAGEDRPLVTSVEGVEVSLSRADEGFLLQLVSSEPERISGPPRAMLPDGTKIDAEQEGPRSWVFGLGTQCPASVELHLEIDGSKRVERFEFEQS